jgi:hypothetical protein
MEVSGQHQSPALLSPGKEPRYPMEGRMAGHQIRFERGSEEQKYLLTPGIEPPAVHSVC